MRICHEKTEERATEHHVLSSRIDALKRTLPLSNDVWWWLFFFTVLCKKKILLKRSLHRLEIPAPIEMKSPIPTAQHHFQFNSVPCALSLKAIKCVPSYTTVPSYYTLSRPVKRMLVKRFFLCWLQSDLLLKINVGRVFLFFRSKSVRGCPYIAHVVFCPFCRWKGPFYSHHPRNCSIKHEIYQCWNWYRSDLQTLED